jgi:hypothetical protein
MKMRMDKNKARRNGISLYLDYPKIWLKNPLIKFVSTTAATPSTAAPVQLTTPAPV